MKKILSLILILILVVSFSSCARAVYEQEIGSITPENVEEIGNSYNYEIEPKHAKADTDATLKICIWGQPTAIYQFNTYVFKNEDSKALIELLNGLTYDEPRCSCFPDYQLYLNDDESSTFGIKLGENDTYVTFGGNQKDISDTIEPLVRQIFERTLTRENYIPIEEESVSITVSKKDGDKYNEYTFKNEDSKRLLIILGEQTFIDRSEGDIDSADIKIKIQDRATPRYGFSTTDKSLITYNKKTSLTDAQASEIQKIVERNCIQQNLDNVELYKKQIYVTINGKQYTFKNDDSEKILNNLYNYVYNSDLVNEYTNGVKIHYKIDAYSVERFYIDIQNNISNISLQSSNYVNTDTDEANRLLSLAMNNCTDSTLITDPEKLSDM